MFFVQSQYYDESFMACHRGFSRLGYLYSLKVIPALRLKASFT